MSEVLVIRTGAANLASVLSGLQRCGVSARLSDNARDVEQAERLILPGVGAFGTVMHRLAEQRLVSSLRERIREGRPTLAMCLGLQLLAEASEESPGVSGIGALPVRVIRFPSTLHVPQIGWNWVESGAENSLLQSGYAWYANSYRIEESPEGWFAASTEYGGRFVAALQRGDVLACQFHPELSGRWGIGLMRRWLQSSCNGGLPC